MVPAHNATSALRITTQCVHQELDITWRLNASHFTVAIFDEKDCVFPCFIDLQCLILMQNVIDVWCTVFEPCPLIRLILYYCQAVSQTVLWYC
jgi:hypothetical protein